MNIVVIVHRNTELLQAAVSCADLAEAIEKSVRMAFGKVVKSSCMLFRPTPAAAACSRVSSEFPHRL